MKLALACSEELAIVDISAGKKVWSAPFDTHPQFSSDEQRWLKWYRSSVNEAKPVGAKRLLITSVAGPVAFADIDTGELRRIAWEPGVHSAELLPGGLVVAAVSSRPDTPPGAPPARGHALVLYDPSEPDQEVWRDAVLSCHGCVYDRRNECLWVLGRHELRRYRCDLQERMLRCEDLLALPDPFGHDLAPDPEGGGLILTTGDGVFCFDPADRSFRPHPILGACPDVKGVSVEPRTRCIAWVQADQGDYLSDRVQFTDPQTPPLLTDTPVYKARWL